MEDNELQLHAMTCHVISTKGMQRSDTDNISGGHLRD
jgi:hypothetical protein